MKRRRIRKLGANLVQKEQRFVSLPGTLNLYWPKSELNWSKARDYPQFYFQGSSSVSSSGVATSNSAISVASSLSAAPDRKGHQQVD